MFPNTFSPVPIFNLNAINSKVFFWDLNPKGLSQNYFHLIHKNGTTMELNPNSQKNHWMKQKLLSIPTFLIPLLLGHNFSKIKKFSGTDIWGWNLQGAQCQMSSWKWIWDHLVFISGDNPLKGMADHWEGDGGASKVDYVRITWCHQSLLITTTKLLQFFSHAWIC